MKKSFLIIGLFSLMMVLTSFNTPSETGGEGAKGDRGTVGTGNYDTGGEGAKGDRGTVGTGNYDTGGEGAKGDRGTVGTGN